MQDKPIVVGIDGSSDSRQALQWAADFGQRYQIPVRAMTVWDTPPTYGRVTYAAPESAHGQSEARSMLADVVHTVVGDNADVVQRIEQGDPGPVLVHEAAEAEFLVVGTRDRNTSFARRLVGSVSMYCIEQASCPVVLCGRERGRTRI